MSGHHVIAVLDNDPERRGTVVAQLAEAGFAPRVLADGQGSVQSVADAHPSAVLCAAGPHLDEALQFCRLCKLEWPVLPVVAYAPQVHAVTRLRFLEVGTDEFVPAGVLAHALPAFMPEQQGGAFAPPGRPEAGTPVVPSQMYMKLGQGELGSAVQFLAITLRSGDLELAFAAAPAGHIYLDKGRIVHAEHDHATGVEAVALMFTRGSSDARFYEGRQAPATTIALTAAQLLIEAAVLADEVEALRSTVSLDRVPVLLKQPKLDELEREAVAVLGGVDGFRTAGELLAGTDVAEVRGKVVLMRLVEAGIIGLFSREEVETRNRDRLGALLESVRQRFGGEGDSVGRQRLLAQLGLLAQAGVEAVPLNYPFPATVRMIHAKCTPECGEEACVLEGVPMECPKCGRPLTAVRASLFVRTSDLGAG